MGVFVVCCGCLPGRGGLNTNIEVLAMGVFVVCCGCFPGRGGLNTNIEVQAMGVFVYSVVVALLAGDG